MGIRLRTSVTAALSPVKRDRLGAFTVLGSGGLFDRKEGTISSVIELFGGSTVLVDCGRSTFDKLQSLGPKKLDAIILTSSDEASIGSLAACVRHLSKEAGHPVNIICMPHIGKNVDDYLVAANDISRDLFALHLVDHGGAEFHFTPSIKYTFKRTGKVTSMFILEATTKDGVVFILHSGFIDRPVFDDLNESADNVLVRMKRDPSAAIIIHDASFYDGTGHCQFEKLSDWSETYRNFFLFGHSEEEGNNIVFSQRYMNSLSTKKDNVFLLEKQ